LNTPTKFSFHLPIRINTDKKIEYKEITINLYDTPKYYKDHNINSRNCLWLEHEKRSYVDCVAIELKIKIKDSNTYNTIFNEFDNYTNEITLQYPIDSNIIVNNSNQKKRFSDTQIGSDCIILGFPENISYSKENLPICKKAMIATDLSINILDLPQFYIDSLTHRGMSGSPVFAIYPSYYRGQDSIIMSNNNKPQLEFLGCYSGRLGETGLSSQLGTIWKEEAIIQIIEHNTPGIDSENLKERDLDTNYERHHDLWCQNLS
jgi:hypothetical protein